MFEFLIFSQFVSALLTILVGTGLIFFIRNKTHQNIKEQKPAGFWVRAICLGMDLAVIDIFASFLAYRGSLTASGYITIVLSLSYFFFFWLFFAATPAMMFARIKIISRDDKPLKFWQILTRLSMYVFLFVGWIPILFDRKEKKALHDIVAKTRVAYAEKEEKNKHDNLVRRIKLGLFGLTAVLLIGLIINGSGEKLTGITENNQIKFFDLNNDDIPDGLMMDADGDGNIDVFKYDLNNDHSVDFTVFDADNDGVAESIDVNNDGRIDGFDFDNDNVLDVKVSGGQFFILLWRVLFGAWTVGFVALLIFAIVKENKLFQK